jgi:hypothetical protein
MCRVEKECSNSAVRSRDARMNEKKPFVPVESTKEYT